MDSHKLCFRQATTNSLVMVCVPFLRDGPAWTECEPAGPNDHGAVQITTRYIDDFLRLRMFLNDARDVVRAELQTHDSAPASTRELAWFLMVMANTAPLLMNLLDRDEQCDQCLSCNEAPRMH